MGTFISQQRTITIFLSEKTLSIGSLHKKGRNHGLVTLQSCFFLRLNKQYI